MSKEKQVKKISIPFALAFRLEIDISNPEEHLIRVIMTKENYPFVYAGEPFEPCVATLTQSYVTPFWNIYSGNRNIANVILSTKEFQNAVMLLPRPQKSKQSESDNQKVAS